MNFAPNKFSASFCQVTYSNMGFFSILYLFCILQISCNLLGISANDAETYIVHVELPDSLLSTGSSTEDLETWYRSFLPNFAAGSNEGSSLLYSYRNVFKGFAAKLSREQLKAMEKIPGFVSAQPEKVLSLHTTHTPDFLGLHQNIGFWNESGYGKGVIIGVLDTGVNPDHPSFSDEGMPPVPSKWKGKCQLNAKVCNKKLIGARFFQNGNDSTMDQNGHGTHTASTAAGNFVKGANVFGNANGTAAGIAPLAHLAIYKVCTTAGCPESAILAAMDVAIDDGVDVLSLSLGGGSIPFYSDNIALGSYSAMKKGIFVSCSAGNDGPFGSTLSNEAPWILTVGASTIDRRIRVTAKLGNNEEFDGESAYQPKDFPPTQFPLFYPGMNASDLDSKFCSSTLINNTEARGKIVVCDSGGGVARISKGQNVKEAGGLGMIIINQEQYGYTTLADAHVLPAAHLTFVDGLKVVAYINSTRSPTASISFKGTLIGDNHAPVVAGFSSRGPSVESPGILKPDIIGPGVNILAAWPRSIENITTTKSNFNVISGTSMSCPHLSGVAALLKSVHPHWSSAAIKSAIMTTANVVNLAKNPIEDQILQPANIFATGSGHVNPAKANNPGLVYDIEPEDYIPYLCGLNYTNSEVETIVQKKVNCSASIAEAQLNYPSFSITFGSRVQTYTRTVTNVGEADSSYKVEVVPPPNVNVTVKPDTLKFSQLNQKLKYEVTFTNIAASSNSIASQGFISWNSAKYSVRSPIVAIMSDA